MLYELAGHVLLPAGITATQLREQAAIAERVLGLRGGAAVVFIGEAALDAARAVALQVALQFQQDPQAFLLESYGAGTETMSYREGVLVHPVATQIVAQLYAELSVTEPDVPAWPVMGSWR